MFPVDFALKVIARHSDPGDLIVDPFCGRGTSVYAAGALGRRGYGVEINAVGWTYASTKISPSDSGPVIKRLKEIASKSSRAPLTQLPQFFVKAYAPNIRRFLTVARDSLDWRHNHIDRTAMAMLVLYAHGNRSNSFSNQMRQTKAMSPQYAIRWWDERGLKPPTLYPIDFLESRIAWRYRYGSPDFTDATVELGDATKILKRVKGKSDKWSLLLTSPPYMKMANYHYDQWIRLWLLGGEPHPVVNGGANQSWFANSIAYREMLASVFGSLAKSAKRNAVVYVRTDARESTKRVTLDVLKECFPKKTLSVHGRPMKGASQTNLYNDVVSPGEVDIILT